MAPDRYYFRIHLSFDPQQIDYKWLNQIIAVGSAIRLPHAVVYDAYAIRYQARNESPWRMAVRTSIATSTRDGATVDL